MANPASVRQRVLQYVSPNIADTLFYITKEGRRSDIPEPGTKYPGSDDKFAEHVFCFAEQADDQGTMWHWWYINSRTEQDAYNWEFSQADIGGTNFDAVVRTYVTLREDYLPLTPLMGATMVDTPSGVFSGTYVLAERKQVRTDDPKVDSLFVIDRQTYVKKVSLYQCDYDEQLGGNLQTTQTLYYATEVVSGGSTAAELFADDDNAYWGLQSDGVVRYGKQLTARWFVVTERQVVSSGFLNSGRTYQTTVDFSWPGVLSDILVNTWPRREGGQDQFAIPIFSNEAYRGPCKATITETFHVTAPTPDDPNVMLPLPIDISTPFFSFSMGPTLHAYMKRFISSGTAHPVYKYTNASFVFPATNPVQWPNSVLKSDEVQPFRGGFLRTKVVVDQPAYTHTSGDGGANTTLTVTGTLKCDGSTGGTPPVMTVRPVAVGGKPYYSDAAVGTPTSFVVWDGGKWRMQLTIGGHVGFWVGTGDTAYPDNVSITWVPTAPATGAPTLTLT